MHLTKSLLKLIACGSLITLLSGCASVICGPKQTVAIDTKPHGAAVLVYDSHCDVVFQQTSPCVAKLPRRTADYEGANYVILIKKEGFVPVQIPLTAEVNKAYFANILFGGVGMAIDPLTGGMWTLSPDVIDPKVISENGSAVQGGLLVSLREDTGTAPDVAQETTPAAVTVAQQLKQSLAQHTAPEAALEAKPAVPETQPAVVEAKPSAPQEAAPEAKAAAPQAEQQTKEVSPEAGKAASDVAQKPESQNNK
jgi:hypothetical protein